jgi:hypothetical protein
MVIPHLYSSFVAEGSCSKPKSPVFRRTLLLGARDWKLLVDYDSDPIVFPPEISLTTSRPDVIIWSAKLKKVVLIELTCQQKR